MGLADDLLNAQKIAKEKLDKENKAKEEELNKIDEGVVLCSFDRLWKEVIDALEFVKKFNSETRDMRMYLGDDIYHNANYSEAVRRIANRLKEEGFKDVKIDSYQPANSNDEYIGIPTHYHLKWSW